jgi:hypothetical protein
MDYWSNLNHSLFHLLRLDCQLRLAKLLLITNRQGTTQAQI